MLPAAGRMTRAPSGTCFMAAAACVTVHIGSVLPVVISVGTAMVSSREVRSGRFRLNDLIAVSMPRRFARQKAVATMAAAAGSLVRVPGPRRTSVSMLARGFAPKTRVTAQPR